MRFAVIDCGTNTFHLLIADVERNKIHFLLRRKMVVKLASGRKQPDQISSPAFRRALNVMNHYADILTDYEPDKVIATATAAFRDAANGKDLLHEILLQTDIDLQIISGEEEALLIAQGVMAAVPMSGENILIMDIGGGSTEFIICNKNEVLWKHSFRLGAARLIQELTPSDPYTQEDIDDLNRHLDKELLPLIKAVESFRPVKLVGASGSFDTFAAIILKRNNTPELLRKRTHYIFNTEDYKKLHKELIASTYQERLKMPGMLQMRADMIVMASLLLTFVLQNCKLNVIELSGYALKEGLLSTAIQNSTGTLIWPKS